MAYIWGETGSEDAGARQLPRGRAWRGFAAKTLGPARVPLRHLQAAALGKTQTPHLHNSDRKTNCAGPHQGQTDPSRLLTQHYCITSQGKAQRSDATCPRPAGSKGRGPPTRPPPMERAPDT